MASHKKAFISHSSADDRYVTEFVQLVRSHGFDDVFNDSHTIEPDDDFWARIEQGIRDCDEFIVILSRASVGSYWVNKEVQFAREIGKRVVGVRIEDCTLPPGFDGRDVVELIHRAKGQQPIDISRFVKRAPPEFIGRDDATGLLDELWQKACRSETHRAHVLVVVGLGGEGKTSLVAKWVADQAYEGWPGCEGAFAWSFYHHGAREQTIASSDLFLCEALRFFGDGDMASSASSPYDKGRRLAQLVGERRALLILDGLEPLQYAPVSPLRGELKDPGLSALLNGLAALSQGLCIVTTRYSLPDLNAFYGKTACEVKLSRLSREAGVLLLKRLGVKGSETRSIPLANSGGGDLVNEYEKLVEDVKGHALTLALLGKYIEGQGGSIHVRDHIRLDEADAHQGGHAFRVMDAYVRWMAPPGLRLGTTGLLGPAKKERILQGRCELALLRLLGLFDRPAPIDCLGALWRPPGIPDLTRSIVSMTQEQRLAALDRLERAHLLVLNRDKNDQLVSVDTHPIIREYFAKHSKEMRPRAWREAHKRIYTHLCATAPEITKPPKPNPALWMMGFDSTKSGPWPSLVELEPLFQAVAHGCLAGLHREVLAKVYMARIQRGEEFHSFRRLGAFAAGIQAMACFFDHPWDRPAARLHKDEAASLTNNAGMALRATGRLLEAARCIDSATQQIVALKGWHGATTATINMAELTSQLGDLPTARTWSESSLQYAQRSGIPTDVENAKSTIAHVLHLMGDTVRPHVHFQEAESILFNNEPDAVFLYSLKGFNYGELLLNDAERLAWRSTLGLPLPSTASAIEACNEVAVRARSVYTRRDKLSTYAVADRSYDQLLEARALLHLALLSGKPAPVLRELVQSAVAGFRLSGRQDFMPIPLLTEAWALKASNSGPAQRTRALAAMNEAHDIAGHCGARLYKADIHLYRARLFFREEKYPWASPEQDLAEARELIEQCKYWRRKEELADAELVILGKKM